MLTLYYAPGSSSMASHVVLEEVAAVYGARLVNEEPANIAAKRTCGLIHGERFLLFDSQTAQCWSRISPARPTLPVPTRLHS
jgi:hypothetical protein